MSLLVALALAAPGNTDPLTLEAARKLSPQALERRIFQRERGTTREVAVRDLTFDTRRANQRAEFSVEFADAPHSTSLRGLCGVQVRTAVFGRGYAPHAGAQAQSHLIEISEQTRYAIRPDELSAPKADGDGCVPAPVLGNRSYFEVSGIWGRPANPGDVARAVQSISGMIRDGAGRDLPPIACTGDVFADLGGPTWAPLCASAAKAIGALRWEEVSSMSVRYCGGGKLCISAYFQRPVEPRSGTCLVELKFELDEKRDDIDAISLLGVTAVD